MGRRTRKLRQQRQRNESYDAGNPDHVAEAKAESKSAEEQEAEDLKVVLSTPAGRRAFWAILGRTYVSQSAPPGEENMARFEGGRDIGTWLIDRAFTFDPDMYMLMVQESLTRKMENERG